MKSTRLFLVAILATTLWSCNNEFTTPLDCIDSSQVENTSWFKEYIAQFEERNDGYWYLQVGSYNFQTVYLPGNCCPYCSTVPAVLNCQGEQIGVLGTRDGQIDPDEIKDVQVIWRSPDFKCQL